MNRIEKLRKYINNILLNKDDFSKWLTGYIHLYGVAQSCAMIAKKRGLDAELATIAGMLHDIHSFKYKYTDDHAEKGAVLAREILNDLGITDENETNLICTAIYNHSNKDVIDSDFDELLKDADVFQHCFYNVTFPIKEHEIIRYGKLLNEFVLSGTV